MCALPGAQAPTPPPAPPAGLRPPSPSARVNPRADRGRLLLPLPCRPAARAPMPINVRPGRRRRRVRAAAQYGRITAALASPAAGPRQSTRGSRPPGRWACAEFGPAAAAVGARDLPLPRLPDALAPPVPPPRQPACGSHRYALPDRAAIVRSITPEGAIHDDSLRAAGWMGGGTAGPCGAHAVMSKMRDGDRPAERRAAGPCTAGTPQNDRHADARVAAPNGGRRHL